MSDEVEGLRVKLAYEDAGTSKQIKALQNNIKTAASEFKLAGAGVKNFGSTLDGLKAKQTYLNTAISNQSSILGKYKSAIEETKTKLSEQTRKQEELIQKVKEAKSAYTESANNIGKDAEATKKLKEEYEKLEQKLSRTNASIRSSSNALNTYRQRANNTEAAIRELEVELTDTNNRIATQTSKWYELSTACQTAAQGLSTAGKTMKSVGSTMTTKVTMPTLVVGGAAISAASNFEEQMDRVLAISGATTEEFKELTDKAKEMGANTKYTATEAGQAMEYMAMAGWKADQMLAGLDGIMNLAAASGEELGLVSDIVTDAMTAFGMSAEEAGHFADVLAAAATNSNTNVEMLGESFKYAAPLAGAFKMNVEDTALVLGLMANAGVKSSQSGTALRTLFTKLSDDIVITKENGEELVVKTQNADGTMRNLKGIIEDLRNAFNGMSESEKNAINDDLIRKAKELNVSLTDDNGAAKSQMQLYADVTEAINNATSSIEGLTDAEKVQQAEAISSKFAMSGVLALINASEEDYNKLANAVYNCNGAAEKMADTMIDNLKGDWTLLKSQLEGVSIQLGDVMIPMFRDAIDNFSEWITKFSELDQETQRNIVKFTLLAAALGPVLKIGGSALNLASEAIGIVGKVSKKISETSVAIKTTRSVTKALTTTFGTFNLALGGVGLAIGAVCAALLIWKSHCDKVKEANEKMLESARQYRDSANELEKLIEKYKQINELSDDDTTKREQLREVQSELIKAYDIEASSIDLVNGKYEEQIELLREAKQAKEAKSEQAFRQNLHDTEINLNEVMGKRIFDTDYWDNAIKYDNAIKDIIKDYGDVIKIDERYTTSGTFMFNTDNPEEYLEVLNRLILRLQDYGIYSGGLYDRLKKQYNNLSESLEKYSEAQKEAFTPKYEEMLSPVLKNLNLEDATEYTEEQIEKIRAILLSQLRNSDVEFQKFVNNMIGLLPKAGKVIKDNLINNMDKSTESIEALEEALSNIEDRSKECEDAVKDFASDLKTLDSAIEKVREGGELSGEEIVNLTDKYSDLEVKIDETTGARYIELEALEKLRGELPNLSKAQIETERERTQATITEAKKRMQVYMSEQQYLQGLVKYNSDTNEIDWGNIPDNIRDDILSSNPQAREQYSNALTERQKIIELQEASQKALDQFEKNLSNIDTISSTKGKNASSSKEKEESELDKAIEAFEKRVKLGNVQLNEEMSQLEEIKNKYAESAEERQKIDEYIYNNYLSVIERKRELNKISTSEEIKLYEQGIESYASTEYQKVELSKKALDLKVSTSKEWIETEKYYNRLSLEDELAAYKRIKEYVKDNAEYKKEMSKEIYRVEKELLEQQKNAAKEKAEANIKAAQEEYEKKCELIDSELEKRLSAYNKELEALEDKKKSEEDAEKAKKYEDTLSDLRDQMNGARTQDEFLKLKEQYDSTLSDQKSFTRDQEVNAAKEAINKKIKAAQNEASAAKKIEEQKFNNFKSIQEKIAEEAGKAESSITSNLAEEIKKRGTLFTTGLTTMLSFINSMVPQFQAANSQIMSASKGINYATVTQNLQNASAGITHTTNNTTTNNTQNLNLNTIVQALSGAPGNNAIRVTQDLMAAAIKAKSRAKGK